jgi:hypothetical protein
MLWISFSPMGEKKYNCKLAHHSHNIFISSTLP